TRWGCWTAGSRRPPSGRRAATTRSPTKDERHLPTGRAPGATCANSSTKPSWPREPDMNTGRQPETVREYLDALQIALKGCPPALIRDALTDAEEHLRNEIIQHPAQSEREVLMDSSRHMDHRRKSQRLIRRW